MFCTQCGSKNPDDARFCHKCGQSIWQAPKESPVSAKPIGLNEISPIPIPSSSQNHVRGKRNGSLNGVGGWLLLLCISLTILSPLHGLANIMKEWNYAKPLFEFYPGLNLAVTLEVLCSIALTAYSIYAGSELWSVKLGAVKVTKNYLVTSLFYLLVSPFVFAAIADLPSAFNDEIAKEGAKNAILGILSFAIWFTYLNKSKRVRATYPTPETHVHCPDCRKLVPKEACVCEYCGCNLIPQS